MFSRAFFDSDWMKLPSPKQLESQMEATIQNIELKILFVILY